MARWAAASTPWRWGIERGFDLSVLPFSPLCSGDNLIFCVFTFIHMESVYGALITCPLSKARDDLRGGGGGGPTMHERAEQRVDAAYI